MHDHASESNLTPQQLQLRDTVLQHIDQLERSLQALERITDDQGDRELLADLIGIQRGCRGQLTIWLGVPAADE